MTSFRNRKISDKVTKNILWIQNGSAKLMMGSITRAENRSLVAESGVEPRIFDRFWISVEDNIVEWRIVDMELLWRYANNRSCTIN